MAEEAAFPDRRKAWWLVALLALAGVMSMIDRIILNVVVDPVRADLGLTDVQIGLLQGLAFGLFYATVGLPLGLTADRYSRRVVVIVGITVWSLATMASGYAHSFGELFAARLLVGLGEAALSPAAISIIADLFPPQERGRPVSLFLMGQAAANGFGISLTSWVADAAAAGRFAGVPLLDGLAAWRSVFVFCGLLGFLVVAGLLTTREPARRTAAMPMGLVAQATSSFAFLKGHARIFVPLYLGFAVLFLAAYGAAAWQPTMLMRAFGASRAELGALLGPLTLVFSVAGPLIGGLLVDRAMRRGDNLARFSIPVLAPLLVIPSGLAVLAPDANLAMLLVASTPAAVAATGTTMLALLQSLVPPGMRGFAVALTGLVNTLIGAVCGPLLVSLLTDHVFRDLRLVGWSIAAVVVPSLLLASLLYAAARRAVREGVTDGTAPQMLLQEIEAGRGRA